MDTSSHATSGVSHDFCTLFDADFAPRALALYRSLERVSTDFRLRAYCMEPGLSELLDRLGLPRLTTVDIREVEAVDPELSAVRPDRSLAEYCFTATPSICLHSLKSDPGLAAITYLDADLMFYQSPDSLLDELGDDSVLVVPHRFAPRWADLAPTHGTFNVGFNTFRRDDHGLAALRWWRDRCLEWCYLRFEDGRYGDQLYLDEFPRRFAGVHILDHRGGGVGPWNSEYLKLGRIDGRIFADGWPLIYYHFSSLHLYRGRNAQVLRRMSSAVRGIGSELDRYRGADRDERLAWGPWPGYRLSDAEVDLIWRPYVTQLASAIAELHGADPTFERGFIEPSLIDVSRAVVRGAMPPAARPVADRLRQRLKRLAGAAR